MGTNERREREREELRQKILDAARELFVDEGYDAVTMRRIAERIEYSPTAIYGYFKDKEALVRELCDNHFLQLAQQFFSIAQIEDPQERLIAAGQAYVKYGVEHPHHYRLMFMTPSLPKKADESALERGNPSEDAYAFLRVTIEECMEAGMVRADLTDPELVSQTVWAAVHGLVALFVAKGGDDWIEWRPIEDVTRLTIETLLKGLARGQEED